MSLMSKIKTYIKTTKDKTDSFKTFFSKNSNNQTDDNKVSNAFYEQACLELQDYYRNLEIVKKEQEMLNGHKHRLTESTEKKLLELIEKDSSILTIQNGSIDFYPPESDRYKKFAFENVKDKKTIGMIAVEFGLYEVAKRALQDPIASTQVNVLKKNIGHVAAENNVYNLVELALNNPIASTQLDYVGENLGMKCVHNRWPELVMKALDNHVASTQVNRNGFNIGMLAAGANFLDWVDVTNFEPCVLKALDNSDAAVQQDTKGFNMGMYSIVNRMEQAGLKALDNKVASLQQTRNGLNMGILASMKNLENVAIKALDNKEMSKQVDVDGWNIGIHVAYECMDRAVEKALEDFDTRNNVNYPYLDMYHTIFRSPNYQGTEICAKAEELQKQDWEIVKQQLYGENESSM